VDTYVIKNARLVDGRSTDLLIESGIIKKIEENINSADLPVITLKDDQYISAGWIDMHTHCFKTETIYHDDCDVIGYQTGVTTVIDAGTTGADTLPLFYETIQKKKTNVYAFINLCKKGIYQQNELADSTNLDTELIKQRVKEYKDFIVGIKVRSSKSVVEDAGDAPLIQGQHIAEELQLPLMVHIGSAPSTLEMVIDTLRGKDIITHILNPKENGICAKGNTLKPCVKKAVEKGIYLDVGHGSDSFSFKALQIASENGIKIDTISTDIYYRNRMQGPVYSLATTMNKFLYSGYSLTDIINKVTKKPAEILGLSHLGEIATGKQADFTIFKLVAEKKELVDSVGEKKYGKKYIEPISVIIKGEYIVIGED
jgi:dihydroorotase